MAGVEDIIGHHGHHYWHHKLVKICDICLGFLWLLNLVNNLSFCNYQNRLITFHTQYISKHFIREPFSTQDQELLETFQNINKLEAENLVEELQKGITF